MTTTQQNSPARRWYDNAMALRAGTITVDEARAFNRALRAEVGDDAYEQAKIVALYNDHKKTGL